MNLLYIKLLCFIVFVLILPFHSVLCCKYCHFICNDRNRMIKHHEHEHAVKEIAILECHEQQQGDTSHIMHLCGHDGCQKSYVEVKRLNEHRKSHYRRYKCPVNGCDKTFWRDYDWKEHIRNKHLRNVPGVQHSQYSESPKCKFCGKRFANIGGLRKHIALIHSEKLLKSFSCRKCGKQFASKCTLERHWKTHENNGERTLDGSYGRFKCTHCELEGREEIKTFAFRYNLNKHIRKYHGANNRICHNSGDSIIRKQGCRGWMYWNDSEVDTLKRLKRLNRTNAEIGKELNRNENSVKVKWKRILREEQGDSADT